MEIHVHRPTLSSPWTGSLVGYRAKKAKERDQTGRRKGKGWRAGGGGLVGSPSRIFSTLPSRSLFSSLGQVGSPTKNTTTHIRTPHNTANFLLGVYRLSVIITDHFIRYWTVQAKWNTSFLKKKCAVKYTWFYATMRLVLWKVFLCKTRNNSIDNIIQSFFGYETTQKSQDLIFGIGRKNNKNRFNSLQACRHSFSKENVMSVLS